MSAPVLILLVILGHFYQHKKIAIKEKTNARALDLIFILFAFSSVWFYMIRSTLSVPLPLHILTHFPIYFFPKILFAYMTQVVVPTEEEFKKEKKSIKDGVSFAQKKLQESFPSGYAHIDAPQSFNFLLMYQLLLLFVTVLLLDPIPGIVFGFAFFALILLSMQKQWHWRNFKSWGFTLIPAVASALLLGAAMQESTRRLSEEFSFFGRKNSQVMSNILSETSIGGSGALDDGEKLVYRVKWGEDVGYLMGGVFSIFYSQSNKHSWIIDAGKDPEKKNKVDFSQSLFPNDSGIFILQPENALEASSQAQISTVLKKEKNALAVPHGVQQILGLPVKFLLQNTQNALATEGSEGFVQFSLLYSQKINAPAPRSADTEYPTYLTNALDQIIEEAKLSNSLSAQENASRLKNFFDKHWNYTLQLTKPDGSARSLEDFLFIDRRGHCEYFATMSALILRRLGIPVRYVTGFMVKEFEPEEKLFWVRERDAHAWNIYWDGSTWKHLDTTVGSALDLYESTPVSDFFNRFQYMLDTYDFTVLSSAVTWKQALPAGVLLLLVLWYRIRKARRVHSAEGKERSEDVLWAEKVCLALEKKLGLPKELKESSVEYWQRVIASNVLDTDVAKGLGELSEQRRAYLFAPHELNGGLAQKEHMRALKKMWEQIKRYKKRDKIT